MPDRSGSRDVAVVDVGSNSVRLVLYRVDGRAIWTVYNEKVLAGLGRNLADTGRLCPEGVTEARAALMRFRAVLDGARPAQLFTAATAAVRDAEDGPAFVKSVRRDTGLDLRIFSGEQEAHASALGVVAGQPDAHGVVGDLGGSSLELVRLDGGRPGKGVTLPLGPLALGAPKGFDPVKIRATAGRRIDRVAAAYQARTFYAVGGAWRNLALFHMRSSAYPLAIVHQYEMSGSEAAAAARDVARQSRTTLERVEGVSKKRAETLPYAALVLEQLVERLGIERVVLSAYGLREGLIYEGMLREVQARDPLVEGCTALGLSHGAADRLGPALEAWAAPFWRSLNPSVFVPDRESSLLAAASRLADIGARLHPDHRADLAFDIVLRAPIAGQTHAERAFLATAVFARYTAQAGKVEAMVGRLLSPERLRRARALGAALRLGADLSGRSPELLGSSSLALDGGAVMLTANAPSADLLLGEQTSKRLATLAELLDRPSAVRRG